MTYDKVNGDVGFLEGPHKYVNLKDSSIQYTSVTTLIEKYGKDGAKGKGAGYCVFCHDAHPFPFEKRRVAQPNRRRTGGQVRVDVLVQRFQKTGWIPALYRAFEGIRII